MIQACRSPLVASDPSPLVTVPPGPAAESQAKNMDHPGRLVTV